MFFFLTFLTKFNKQHLYSKKNSFVKFCLQKIIKHIIQQLFSHKKSLLMYFCYFNNKKERQTMKIIHFSVICSLTAILSACGDSATSAQEPLELSSSSQDSDNSSSSSFESSSSNITKPESSSENQSVSNSSSSQNSTNYNPETGLLTDERDGKVYKTTKIENQIWMAENLNFDIKEYKNTIITDIDELMGENNGYKNEALCPKSSTEDDCNQYGRLYTQIGFLLSLNDKRVYKTYPSVDETLRPYQGVCPTGWHIPSLDEWQTLFNNAYMNELLSIDDGGNNKSGFNVKLIGFAHQESNDIYEKSPNYNNEMTAFATVDDATAEKFVAVWIKKNDANTLTADKKLHYAVRCLKN